MQKIVNHLYDTCMTDENEDSLLFGLNPYMYNYVSMIVAPPIAAMENCRSDTYTFFGAISFWHSDPACHFLSKCIFFRRTHDPRVADPPEIGAFVWDGWVPQSTHGPQGVSYENVCFERVISHGEYW